ncbi:MAG: hypothetical protein B6I20_07290 [Bacteroidetes bacterium 4572_117]|nr:MAG: hypothetical protein B6I20_07290 [Bacteroidetes bacterium 4572_117]
MLKIQHKGFIILLFVFVALFAFSSCNNNEEEETQNDTIDSAEMHNPTIVKINDRLFSVPSPFQIAILIKDNDVPYDKALLNPVQNQVNYSTNYKQALNLGIYGADLSYLNIYEQLPDAASYFAVVKVLSKSLGISSTLDEKVIKRIENNSNNKDSLLYILSTIYRNADAYLFNNDRNEVGLLILAGGWVESLYLMTKTIKVKNNQEIINRIGEQKHPLDNLIELLRPYYGKISDEFDVFLEDLVELAAIFDGVVIEYTYSEPIVDEANKLTTITSETKIIINEYQIDKVTEMIDSIRTKIIN